MKRKALAAIMAVAMAVSMAGCGGSTSESKDSTQKTETADSTASTGGSVENKDKPLCCSTVSHPAVLPANWTKML